MKISTRGRYALRRAQARRDDDGADGPLTLLHAGILYPSERDPRAFFRALSEMKKSGQLGRRGVRVILRATGHDEYYRPILRENGIEDVVELAPGVPYREALQEMLLADGTDAVEGKGKYIKLRLDQITDFDFEENQWKVVPAPEDPQEVDLTPR